MFNKYLIIVLLFSSVLAATITKSEVCSCAQIKEKADCLQNTDCQWNTSCTVKTNALITYCSTTSPCPISKGCAFYNELCTHFTGCTPYLEKTHVLCQAISPQCTSDGIICINIANVCSDFKASEGCRTDVNNNYCFWDETTTSCAQVEACEKLPTSLKTNAECRTAISTCTSKGDGGCVVSGIDCKDQAEAGCFTNSNQTQDCFWDGTACKDKTCENAFSTLVSPIQCQQFLGTCTLAETGSGCITIPENCSGYTSEVQCTSTKSDICFWDGTLCTDWTCLAAPTTLTTHTQCQEFKSDCTVDADELGCQQIKDTCGSYTISSSCVITSNGSSCYWNGKICTELTCSNAILTTYTKDTCKEYLPSCTNSTDGKACTPRTCTTYSTQANCSTDYQNKQCAWSGSCQVRTCANSYSTFISHQECVDWMTSCTISSTGKGCTTQSTDCTEYKLQSQCIVAQNSTIPCVWTTSKTCVTKTCSTAAQDLVTDDDCSNYLPGCTVNANGQGCMARKENCNDYNQLNCVKSTTKSCYWDITKTPSCIIRECSQALLSTNLSCANFLQGCTVNMAGTQCETQKPTCVEYLSSQQCVITTIGNKCIWNLKVSPAVCEDRTCDNSDAVGSDAECAGHLSTCTVNVTKSACITRLANCQNYTALIQCVSTLTNQPCYWYNNQCNPKTCDLAPKTYTTHAECQAYNVNCTTNSKGCQNLVNCNQITSKNSCVLGLDSSCSFVPNCQLQQCADAPTYYTTDDQCKIFASECTTNGQGCVKRGLCSDNYIEQACVTNSSGGKCAWINGICIDYSCLSAPSYSTELECNLYMSGCTVNQSQGCITKTTCAQAKSQAACTTDAFGNECEFSTLGCRDKICTDFSYSTHSDCYNQNNTCTTDGIICVTQTKCQDKLTNTACLIGLDGPCLWVNSKCQLYLNCQSVQETTHSQCQLVSTNCTTDGNQCVPINQCKDTDFVGCFNGTDGLCVRTPPLLGGEVACAKFTACNQVFYSTFEECQTANITCTTDTLSCIDLSDCSTYKTNIGCQINSARQKCYWSENTSTCDDLQCKDLVFTTHIECAAAKSGCTTDQTVCIVIAKCEEYLSEITCNVAQGIQGLCLWDPTVTPQACRSAGCADVTNCTKVAGCIDDGLTCVSLGLCSAYITEKGCKQGGSDGVCVWTLELGKGTCSVMTQCTDASASQEACLKKNWACQWSVNAAGTGTCGQHTCGTKAKEMGTCAPLLDFDQKSLEICIVQNQLCITTDLQSLTSQTCFIGTGKLYAWDSSSCSQCNKVVTDNPNNGSGGGTTTPVVPENGFMITILLLGLIGLL